MLGKLSCIRTKNRQGWLYVKRLSFLRNKSPGKEEGISYRLLEMVSVVIGEVKFLSMVCHRLEEVALFRNPEQTFSYACICLRSQRSPSSYSSR